MKIKSTAFVFAAVAAVAGLSEAAEVVSPLLSGFHPDPSVTRGADGAYYLVTSTFMWSPGLPVYRSDDFRSWSRVGHALPDISAVIEPGDEFTDDDGVWAPTIRFHGGTYYVAFAFHGKEFRNYLTTARNPAGPWTKPVHVKAADGGIDPSLFFDDDGKVYWTATMPARKPNREGHIEIYVQEIDLASGQLVGRREYVTDGVFPGAQWAEGPHVYKKDGVYRLVIAEGGTDFNHAATALKSKSVWGPYLPQKSNPLVTRRDRGKESPLQATGHSDIVEARDGGLYAVFLGKRPIGADRRVTLGRETFACRAEWKDGELAYDDAHLIEGRVVTPEEECIVKAKGRAFRVRRLRGFAFDETLAEAKKGDGLVLWRSAHGYILVERRADGIHFVVSDAEGLHERGFVSLGDGERVTLRLSSGDGLSVRAYAGKELLGEVSTACVSESGKHTHFNGLGIGRTAK